MSLAIEAEGIGRTFATKDGAVGLRELSLSVEQGQVVALLGPNGAGKTTAVRVLATLVRFDRGSARVAGYDVRHEAAEVRARIGLVGQYAAVDEQLTAEQNLRFFGRLRGLDRRGAADRASNLIAQFGLGEARHRAVSQFSGGMRRRLDLAAGLVVTPQVLFVDEPTTGLDPAARRGLWRSLRELADAGTAIVLTTQYLEEADALADQIVLLARGAVVAHGSPDDLKTMVGHSVVQVRFADLADAESAVPALRHIDAEVHLDTATTAATLSAASGDALARTVETLTRIGIAPTEVTLRKPSLDEVFSTLTEPGPTAEEPA